MPLTFQRTLMPKSGIDQAVITGISGALNYGFAALIQDTIEAVALRLSGGDLARRGQPARRGGGRASRSTSRRSALGTRHPDRTTGSSRASGCRGAPCARPGGGSPPRDWPARSSGSPRRSSAAGKDREDRSIPVALPVGIALAAVERIPPPPLGGGGPGGVLDEDSSTSAAQVARHGARRDARAERRRRRRAAVRVRRQQGAREGPRAAPSACSAPSGTRPRCP